MQQCLACPIIMTNFAINTASDIQFKGKGKIMVNYENVTWFKQRQLPNVPWLLFRSILKRDVKDATESLPSIMLGVENYKINPAKLAKFAKTVHWSAADKLPPTYLQVVAFPMYLKVLLRKDFPWAVMGLVHIENEIIQHQAIDIDQPLDIVCFCSDLEMHRFGWQFTINIHALVDGKLVWQSLSKNLIRTGRRKKMARVPDEKIAEEAFSSEVSWDLSGGLGRKYAMASGDCNPIHIHRLTAKLFGFEQPIIHGMWTIGRSMSQVQQELPDAYHVVVKFKQPIFLPNEIKWKKATLPDVEKQYFKLISADGDKEHLIGHWFTL